MEIVDNMANAADEAAERVSSAAKKAAEKLEEKADEFMTLEKRFVKNSRACIRDYPMASVGMALVAGYIAAQVSHSCDYKRR